VVERPPGELVQRRGDVVGAELGEPVGGGRPGQAGRGSGALRHPVPDPGPGLFPVGQRGRVALGDDAPGRDHRHPVGQVLRLVHVVRGQQDGLAERGQVLDHLPRLAPGRGVEPGGRLVEEEQFRVAGQGDRHIEPPLLPAGQLVHPRVPLLLQPDQADHLVHWPGIGVEAGVHPDRLGDRQVGLHAGGLEHDADPALQRGPLPAGVVPEHGHLAAVAGAVPLQDLDRGGLSRPVGPEQGEDLAPADVQVDAVHGPHAGVGLHQPAHVHRERPAVAGAAGRCTPGPGLARQRGHAVIPARSHGSPAPLLRRRSRPAGPRRPGAMIMAQVSLEPH
jgi:hypothetical protein